jgi:hypothetical protein
VERGEHRRHVALLQHLRRHRPVVPRRELVPHLGDERPRRGARRVQGMQRRAERKRRQDRGSDREDPGPPQGARSVDQVQT